MKCHRSYPVNFSESTLCQAFARKCPTMFCKSRLRACSWGLSSSAELFTPLPRAGFPSYLVQFSTVFWTSLWQRSISSFLLQWAAWWLPHSQTCPISELWSYLDQSLPLSFSHYLFSFASFGQHKILRHPITHHALDYFRYTPLLPSVWPVTVQAELPHTVCSP